MGALYGPGLAGVLLPSQHASSIRLPRWWQRWALEALLFLCSVFLGSRELLWPLRNWVLEPWDSHCSAPWLQWQPLVSAHDHCQRGGPGHQHSGPVPSCLGHCALSVVPGIASPVAGFSPAGPPALCPAEFSTEKNEAFRTIPAILQLNNTSWWETFTSIRLSTAKSQNLAPLSKQPWFIWGQCSTEMGMAQRSHNVFLWSFSR